MGPRMETMKCIILAGGFATRLWPLTEKKAKPLLHLKDKPLVSHIVEGLPKDLEVIISTNAAFEDDFRNWSAGYSDRKIEIMVEDSKEDQFKKGALGATAMAIEELGIDEDLLLIAGDNYFGFQFDDFFASYKNNPLLAAFDIGDLSRARKFGVVVQNEGKVTEFQEKPQDPKSTLVSTGCYLFPKRHLVDIVDYARKKNDDLGGIFEYLLQKGSEINVFRFSETWYDVGSFEGYIKANQELLNNQTIESGKVIKLGSNRFQGSVYLADGTVIEDSIVENAVILKGSKIKNCVIRNCIVDEQSDLKNIDLSFKMIRQGSRIEK